LLFSGGAYQQARGWRFFATSAAKRHGMKEENENHRLQTRTFGLLQRRGERAAGT